MTNGHLEEPDYFLAYLQPLLQGMSVKLVLEQERMHGQASRLVQKGLLIAPGNVYGLNARALVISLLGSGSCVIFPDSQTSRGELVKAGLPSRLAIALIDSLKKLYGDSPHGSAKTTSKTRSTKRRKTSG